MVVTPVAQWRNHFSGPVWEEVFTFLQSLCADAPECDIIPLSREGLFARIMAYPVRGPEGAVLEAHNRHIDVQMSLVNREGIAWYPRSILTVREPYDADRDVIFFHRPGPGVVEVENLPGIATVLFPEDAHMAQLARPGDAHSVKKVVVKVPVALLHNQFSSETG